MGAQNSNPMNSYITKEWKLRQKTETSSIYRHSISQDLCQRTIIYGVEQKQIDIYQQRKAYSYIHNPIVYSLKILRDPKNNKFISEGWTLDVEVIVENVDTKLSDFLLNQLTFQIGFWDKRLEQVFLGFQYLFHKYGPFKITSDMIGWSQNRSIKTWLNPNFSRNQCQKEGQTEKTMINDLKCIFSFVFGNKMEGIHKFEESIRFLKNFFSINQRSQPVLMTNPNSNPNSISMSSIRGKLRRTIKHSQTNQKINFSYESNSFDQSCHNQLIKSKTVNTWNFNQSLQQSVFPKYGNSACQTENNFYKTDKKIRKQEEFFNRKIGSSHQVNINDSTKNSPKNTFSQFRQTQISHQRNSKGQEISNRKEHKYLVQPVRREIIEPKDPYNSRECRNESLNQSSHLEIRNTMDSMNLSVRKPSSSTNYNSERMSSFNSRRQEAVKKSINEAIKKQDFSSSCRIKLQFNQNKKKTSQEKYLYRSTKNPHTSINKRLSFFEDRDNQDPLIKHIIKSNHVREQSYTFDPKHTSQVKGFQKVSKNMLLLKQSKVKQLQEKVKNHEYFIEQIDQKQICEVNEFPEATRVHQSFAQNKFWMPSVNEVEIEQSKAQLKSKKSSNMQISSKVHELKNSITSMKLVENGVDQVKEEQQNIENQFDALFATEEQTQNSQVSFDDLRFQLADILS